MARCVLMQCSAFGNVLLGNLRSSHPTNTILGSQGVSDLIIQPIVSSYGECLTAPDGVGSSPILN